MHHLEKFLEEAKDGNSKKSYLISCSSVEDQESKRTSMFYKRGKLPPFLADLVGIRKRNIEGQMFIELFPRGRETCYFLEDGVMTPVVKESSEKIRIRMLMEADGISEEEIMKTLSEMSDDEGV
jgi:hypothetical protein